MKFFKCLLQATHSFDYDAGTFYETRFSFKDITNPQYPRIDIWRDGVVQVFDAEGRVYIPDDETILKYCNMKDDELVLVSNSKSVA